MPDAMPGSFRHFTERLRAQMPTPDQLARQRWLRPIAHRLTEHGLWHAKPEAVARGVAIGLFWAFVVPFAQILFAAAHCVWWRANIPVAAAVTLITNPFTIGGWLYLAYQVGSWFVPARTEIEGAVGWLARLQALGWPTVLGMALFAVGGATLGYLLVRGGSRVWLHWRLARRLQRQRVRTGS
jgi:uncharacterized protein (DUF2062 family)